MCEWCDYSDDVDIPNSIYHSDSAHVEGSRLKVYLGYETGYININFCPMCGRKLMDEDTTYALTGRNSGKKQHEEGVDE